MCCEATGISQSKQLVIESHTFMGHLDQLIECPFRMAAVDGCTRQFNPCCNVVACACDEQRPSSREHHHVCVWAWVTIEDVSDDLGAVFDACCLEICKRGAWEPKVNRVELFFADLPIVDMHDSRRRGGREFVESIECVDDHRTRCAQIDERLRDGFD